MAGSRNWRVGIKILRRKRKLREAYEKVSHPAHYGGEDNPYECIKVIEAWGLDKDFCLGTVLRYISRMGKKPGESLLDDLKKSLWYMKRRVEQAEKRKQ